MVRGSVGVRGVVASGGVVRWSGGVRGVVRSW